MIEILIQSSKKADKKFDAVIDGEKLCPLGQKVILILLNIKTQQENKGIWTDTKPEKTGLIQPPRGH